MAADEDPVRAQDGAGSPPPAGSPGSTLSGVQHFDPTSTVPIASALPIASVPQQTSVRSGQVRRGRRPPNIRIDVREEGAAADTRDSAPASGLTIPSPKVPRISPRSRGSGVWRRSSASGLSNLYRTFVRGDTILGHAEQSRSYGHVRTKRPFDELWCSVESLLDLGGAPRQLRQRLRARLSEVVDEARDFPVSELEVFHSHLVALLSAVFAQVAEFVDTHLIDEQRAGSIQEKALDGLVAASTVSDIVCAARLSLKEYYTACAGLRKQQAEGPHRGRSPDPSSGPTTPLPPTASPVQARLEASVGRESAATPGTTTPVGVRLSPRVGSGAAISLGASTAGMQHSPARNLKGRRLSSVAPGTLSPAAGIGRTQSVADTFIRAFTEGTMHGTPAKAPKRRPANRVCRGEDGGVEASMALSSSIRSERLLHCQPSPQSGAGTPRGALLSPEALQELGGSAALPELLLPSVEPQPLQQQQQQQPPPQPQPQSSQQLLQPHSPRPQAAPGCASTPMACGEDPEARALRAAVSAEELRRGSKLGLDLMVPDCVSIDGSETVCSGAPRQLGRSCGHPSPTARSVAELEQRLSQLSTLQYFDIIVDTFAGVLCAKYERQLGELTAAGEDSGARRLAEWVTARVLDELFHDGVDALLPLDSQLILCVEGLALEEGSYHWRKVEQIHDAVVGTVWGEPVPEDVRQGLLLCKDPRRVWYEWGVLTRPGVRCASGACYTGPRLNVHEYDFRLAPQLLAERLGLRQIEGPSGVRPPSWLADRPGLHLVGSAPAPDLGGTCLQVPNLTLSVPPEGSGHKGTNQQKPHIRPRDPYQRRELERRHKRRARRDKQTMAATSAAAAALQGASAGSESGSSSSGASDDGDPPAGSDRRSQDRTAPRPGKRDPSTSVPRAVSPRPPRGPPPGVTSARVPPPKPRPGAKQGCACCAIA
eukprot:TRINITY_DN18176_c2_g1_i1.p1 TRINITY_DN18176_c2_g1~~TRINITY_DN18176_c2_g1_i1.p1  ORF type:complete len:965 (+),score=265.48 TRINITY_DN18176_c2_g1_i1:83-2896(+)